MTPPSLAPPVRLVLSGRTDPGRRRSENQDDFLIADLTVPSTDGGLFVRAGEDGPEDGPLRLTLGPRGVLLIVADGMGGQAAGGLASRLATSWIHEDIEQAWGTEPGLTGERFATCLRLAIERTNQRVFQQSVENPELRDMGTTATVAGILDDALYLAQVGDSRAYLSRGSAAVQLTRDQSVVWAMVAAGAMTEEQAENSPQRHAILQAIGPRPEVQADLSWQQLRRGDTLLLCSDGLSQLVPRAELGDLLSSAPDPAAACRQLVDLANERGAPDNITAVVANLEGDGLSPPSPDDPLGYATLPDEE